MNIYSQAFAQGIKPDPSYTVSEWSDTYRILPSKGSAQPGKYRTARVPFLREIMDCLSPHSPVQRVVFMKPSQVGGTEMGLNWLGCVMHMYPAPMMIVQPTIELAERFSKQRVAPMIEETPELREVVSPPRSRDSSNSILLKEFRGGILVMAGSNSGVSLRQMPVKYLFADEISGYAPDADGEGDPVSLAEKRTQTFGVRKKVFLNSTPKEKHSCRIEFEYQKTGQRRYYVPCPHCGEMQHLKWKQLKWENEDPSTAHYVCEMNGCIIHEFHKTKMLAGGEWRATAPESPTVRGYHINALYSPLGWKSWAEIVQEWLEAVDKARKGDPSLLKAFVNSVRAETYEEDFSNKVGAEGLRSRAENYTPGVAPAGALVLVAGVDVQDNRIEVTIYGYGRGEESWVVSHVVIFGDPSRAEIWKQLDSVLLSPYKHASGVDMQIRVACLDSGGHYTHESYQYVRERKRLQPKQYILAVKGQSQKNKPALGKPSKQDVNYRGQVLQHGVDLYPVGTDTIKTTLYARFQVDKPGPGYMHFHGELTVDFFEQITSERRVMRLSKRTGRTEREWVLPPGKRNEALDCAVYGYAAFQFVCRLFHPKTMWDQLAAKLGAAPQQVHENAKEVTDTPQNSQATDQTALKNKTPQRNLLPNRRGKGFVTGW